jgi:hypothetical protein
MPHVKNYHHEIPTNAKKTPNKTFFSSSRLTEQQQVGFKGGGDDNTTPIGNCGNIFLDSDKRSGLYFTNFKIQTSQDVNKF